MQREGAVPGSSVQNKMTRIASLDQSTKHLELLARRTVWRKMVLEFCGVVASRPFSAPPNRNRQPDDRHFGLFFSPVFVFDHFAGLALPAPHSGWSTPMPHRSLFYLLIPPPSLLTTTPPAPLSLFNNKSLPSSSTLPDLR
jgi:hypothetical protein